ncbi:MAG: DUF89 family protein [Lentisphaerae bacterium]|nr:DUF89 family protein [Lentisphaerota bacterium]
MNALLDCLPCLTRNAVSIAKKCTDDPVLQHRIVTESMHLLADCGMHWSPAYYVRDIMEIALKHCGDLQADPYRPEKEKSTTLAKNLLPELKNISEYDSECFESRLRLAIAGNVLDFGIYADLDLKDAVKIIRQTFIRPIDRAAMRKLELKIREARRILYLLDNCGEAVFDRIFIDLFKDKVTIGVRGRNTLNDVTRKELEISGFDASIPVVDNGSSIPGTMPEFIGEEFRRTLEAADLIIAKGQGNFETLDAVPYPVSFLFLAKCPVVTRKLGTEINSIQIRNLNF